MAADNPVLSLILTHQFGSQTRPRDPFLNTMGTRRRNQRLDVNSEKLFLGAEELASLARWLRSVPRVRDRADVRVLAEPAAAGEVG
jgi:hypothetical protein